MFDLVRNPRTQRSRKARTVRPPRKRRVRRKHLTRAALCMAVLFLGVKAVGLVRGSTAQSKCDVPLVISMTTTGARVTTHFPTAFKSLMRQTAPCVTLFAFVPFAHADAIRGLADDLSAAALAARKNAFVFFVPDRGPSTKYIYTLEALVWKKPSGWLPTHGNAIALGEHPTGTITTSWVRAQVLKLRAHRPLILVCDDDSWYPHSYVQGMLQGRERIPQAERGVTAGRGWRIPADYVVHPPGHQRDDALVEGWRIAAPYRVGIATSDKGVLFQAASLRGANLSNSEGVGLEGAPLADDAWINGAWAAAGVPRWVVPLAHTPVDLPASSLLDDALHAAGLTRHAAINAVLQHYGRKTAWETSILQHSGAAGEAPVRTWVLQRWWWRVWRMGVAARMALTRLER